MKRKIILCASILGLGMRVSAQCPTSGTISSDCTTTGDLTVSGGSLIVNPGVTMTVTGKLTLKASGSITASSADIVLGSFTDGNGNNTITGGTYTISGDLSTSGGGDLLIDGATINATGAASLTGADITVSNSTINSGSLSSNLNTLTLSNSNFTTTGTGDFELEEATVTSCTFNIGGDLFIDSGTTTVSDSDLDVGVGYADGVSQTALSMNGGGKLYLNNNTTLDVKGHLQNNELYINNSHVVITGDFDNRGSEILEVSNGGSISIGGDFDNGGSGSTTAESGGTIDVDGDYDNTGGGTTTVDGGGMVVGGTYSGTDPTVTGGADENCSGGGGGCCGSACASMPVSLLSFDVDIQLDHIALSWKTASELNNDHFNIHRSTNGVDFEIIDWVAGHGTTNEQKKYELQDYPSQKGIYYYQLEQVDYDGANEFFPIKKVNYKLNQNAGLTIYPMPVASGEDFYINYSGEEQIIAKVYDLTGSLSFELPYNIESGKIRFDASSLLLPRGIYVIQINMGAEVYAQRINVK
ncbi:MAG: T9SS type A sorting domain-containing protein [Reichenbachiella sp.]|uniref:T9SS type A sorting domain-containing protein n=1 Tax=Reichenbachiella sp. TaxID=2184521 RepID=UPI0032977CBF